MEYTHRETWLHNLHPIAKFCILLPMAVVLSFYLDPLMILIATVVVLYLSKVAEVPWGWYWFALFTTTLATPVSLFTGGTIFFYDPKWYVVYNKIFDVGFVLIPITPEGFPIIGRTAVTIGGLLYQAQLFIKRFLAFGVIYVLMYTTSPSEVTNMLATYGFPSPIMFIIMSFMRFFTIIQRKALRILDAQKLRGIITTSHNPFKVVREAFPLVFPLIRSIINMNAEVTKSCEMRAFGVRKVSPYKPITMNIRDKLVTVIFLIVSALMLYGIFFHNIGKL